MDTAGGWDVRIAGLGFGLESVLVTLAAAVVIVTIAARAARLNRRSQIGPFVMLVEGSLLMVDRAVTVGPTWARRRIGALAFTGFWFVLVSHWLDLIPAIALQTPISDINVALALGIVALGVVHATAAQVVGARAYLQHWFRPVYLFPRSRWSSCCCALSRSACGCSGWSSPARYWWISSPTCLPRPPSFRWPSGPSSTW